MLLHYLLLMIPALASAAAPNSTPLPANVSKVPAASTPSGPQPLSQPIADVTSQPDDGFLSNTWRDRLTIVSIIGVAVTILAFIGGIISIRLATRQLAKTTEANEAATKAAAQQLNEIRDRYRSNVVVQLNGLFKEAKLCVELRQWSHGALRLSDIVNWIQQSSYEDAELITLSDGLSKMATTFSRIQREELTFSDSLPRKWDTLCKEFSQKIGQLSAPFPAPLQGEHL
jgi:type II secretory pathway pseudopilin PulG